MCSHKWILRLFALLLALTAVLTCAFGAELEAEQEIPRVVADPLTAGLLEANSNRQIHPFPEEEVVSSFTTEGFERIGQTDQLTIYLNRQEAALRILNRDTGYLWGAVQTEEAEGLSASWRCYANGLVSIECFNEEGVESRASIGKDGEADYAIVEDGLLCTAFFPKQGIRFQVKVQWTEDRITMELVEGSLEEGLEGSGYTLKSMTFLPFLGSAYSDSVDGYILIPDGSGALIRYSRPANYTSTYAGRILNCTPFVRQV